MDEAFQDDAFQDDAFQSPAAPAAASGHPGWRRLQQRVREHLADTTYLDDEDAIRALLES